MNGNRRIALLSAGIVIGAIMIGPAGADISDSVAHLWNDHLKERVTDLTYTKNAANYRFNRSAYKTYSKPPQDKARQVIGGPFSIYCDNNPAGAQLEYEAPEDVRVIVDWGASGAISIPKKEGETFQPPEVQGALTQMSTWVVVADNSYTRYVVSLTSDITTCHGIIETIRTPAG